MTAIAPTTPLFAETAALEAVEVDIYRDVHKGIRSELFAVTLDAGRVDPHDDEAVGAVAGRWGSLVKLLVEHARHEEDFVPVVKEATGGRGADVVYDPVGGEAFQKSTKCIAFEGRILVVGFTSGVIPSAALNHALVKNYSILGLHWGLYERLDPAAVRACHAELTKFAAAGLIRPLITERLSLADVPDGLRRLAAGTTAGRLVFQP